MKLLALFFTVSISNFIGICIAKGINVGLCDSKRHGCKCGTSNIQVILKIKQCTYFRRWKPYCKPCKAVDPEVLCSKFLNCAECHVDGGGERCVSCPRLKFGTWCEATCDCRNDATCDRQGKCICAEGYEGDRCERNKGCVPRQPVVSPLQEILHPPESPRTITYMCPPDYELRGNPIATCLNTGQWSSVPPQCFPKCPLLSAPAGGSLKYSRSDLVEGVTATVQCYPYHRLIGASKVKCLPGGQWSSALPICEKLSVCPNPGLTTYSTRQVGPLGSSPFGPFYEGMTLRYTCVKGFEQLGSNAVTCLPEGIWSDEPPICVKVSRVIASCGTKASDVIQENDIPVRLFCPHECAQHNPNVWGTAIYTTDSAVCPAAVHAGMVTNSGGLVEVISNGNYPCFTGSNMNKIQSQSSDEQAESFRFSKLPASAAKKEGKACSKGLVQIGEVCVYIPDKLKTKEEANAICTNLGLSLGFPKFGKEEDSSNLTTLLQRKGINQVWTSKISVPQGNFSDIDEEANRNLSDAHMVEPPKPKCVVITASNRQTTEDLEDCETKMNFICFQNSSSQALATCREPDHLSNGQATPIGRIDGVFYVGSSMEYTCDPLHYMKGTPSIFCTEDGTWSGETPKCILVITCDDPPVPIGGLVEYHLPIRNSPSPRKTFVHFLTDFRISGVPVGLKANTQEVLRNVSTIPEPEIVELPPGKYQTGTIAVYKCESCYYKLVGSRVRRCETSGRWSGRLPTCMPKCGRSDSPRTSLIVNGEATDIGQWPWQAAISEWTPNPPEWLVVCGGSLLNEGWVITAAHCVTYNGTNVLISKEKFRVYLGRYHREESEDDDYVQMREAYEIHIHPDYNPFTFDSDIALILLDVPVQLNSRTQPVCLPTERTTRENLVEGNKGVVTGWGLTEEDTFAETLLQAVLPVVSTETCEEGYIKAKYPLTVTENMFCAGFSEGKADTCSGDSGGPMVFLDRTSREMRWVIEGIISWGSPNGCGKPDQYGGFTTVSRFLNWIQLFL